MSPLVFFLSSFAPKNNLGTQHTKKTIEDQKKMHLKKILAVKQQHT
jgi:hypothetical protein